jgi:DNA-directed RNA polymerase subunit F
LLLSRLLIFALVLNGFAGLMPALTPASAQQKNRVIVVNADQPNVWTLEQAHYLLAQMHRRNLDLKATGLGDLDPNEINGLRFDVLRQLIDLGVKFDQAERETNRLISDSQDFNAERRQAQLNRRDALQDESLALTRDITDLQGEKATATTQEDKDTLDARIAAKTARRAEVDKRVEQINEELKTLNAPSGSLKATEAPSAFDASKLPKSVFDKAFEEAAKKQIDNFNEAPKLNATLRLENFLQMQYEIVAKQLTLLRDEVGPGERLLFLELPQTVNVAHHESNQKWAQSWWKIVGYTKRTKKEEEKVTKTLAQTSDGKSSSASKNRRPITSAEDYNFIMKETPITVEVEEADKSYLASTEPDSTSTTRQVTKISYVTEFVNLDNEKNSKLLESFLKNAKADLENRLVRTVDLIPRQSSLNVNDMNLRVKSGAFSAIASFLFGFGARLNVQRQREQFSQFVQQELYSSAFGKGSREFGWTFTPMPGTERLLSGVRTTYAVVVVPEEATSLVLEANGCYFPRSAYQPNNFADTKDTERWGTNRTSRGCADKSKAFVVPIPSGGADGSNDFWVQNVSYQPVGKGKRIVVLISGKNFSSQIGVLVNGVPLTHSIGLAQPLIRDDSKAGAAALEELKGEKVRGRIERVDANKVVFSFEMPEDFEGTPTITLVAPGKAIDINWLDNVEINGKEPASFINPINPCKDKPGDAAAAAGGDAPATGECVTVCKKPGQKNCLHVAEAMFKGDPARPLRIDSVEVFRQPTGNITAVVTGAGFSSEHEVYINGALAARGAFRTPTLLVASTTSPPADDKIQVTISTDDKTLKSTALPNPSRLKIDKVTIVSYEAAKGKKPAVLVVKIEGSGFPNKLYSSVGKPVVTSATEVFLTITNPREAEVVTLTDPVTKLSVNTVVTRKPPPEE